MIKLNHQFFKNYRKMLIATLGLAGVVVLFIGGFYLHFQQKLDPINIEEDKEVEIAQGTSFRGALEQLEQEGVIRDAFIVRHYARFIGHEQRVQAGEYLFTGELSPVEVLDQIAQGKVVDRSVRVTIPEGLRADQVASRLNEHGLGEEEKFLELFESKEWDYWFLEDIPDNVKFPLEGFLFPDTYHIDRDATERQIVERLLDEFEKVFNDDYKEEMQAKDMSIIDLITLASIVEREAVIDGERDKVAGVFVNRLEQNRRLEACATVEYVLQENKPVLSLADIQIDSPYNTYQNAGLPPGPIASPGKASIEAALYPATHQYFYFVSRQDGSGEHVFSKTLSEHNRAKREIRQD